MPVAWTLNVETRAVQFVWHDPYTFAEWAAAMSDILAHPQYEPGFRFLSDRREAAPPTTEFVRSMATFFDSHREALHGARAAVLVHDEAGYGMARMIELITMGRNPAMTIRVFRDSEQAQRWLLTP